MRITCKTQGVQAITDKIGKYGIETDKKLDNVVNGSLKNIAAGARKRLPSGKTGNLRKGLKKSFSKKKHTGTVKETAPHGHLVEFGTKPHSLDKGAKRKVMVINGNPVSGNVMHPGAKKNPFMQPAYYTERANYIANIKKAVTEI